MLFMELRSSYPRILPVHSYGIGTSSQLRAKNCNVVIHEKGPVLTYDGEILWQVSDGSKTNEI
jgi:hypothetical protein